MGRRDSASGERRVSPSGEVVVVVGSPAWWVSVVADGGGVCCWSVLCWWEDDGASEDLGNGSAGVEDLENHEDQAIDDWGACAGCDDPDAGSAGTDIGGDGDCWLSEVPVLLTSRIRSSRNLLISGSTSELGSESFGFWAGRDGACAVVCADACAVLCADEGLAEADSCQNQPIVSSCYAASRSVNNEIDLAKHGRTGTRGRREESEVVSLPRSEKVWRVAGP